VAIASPGQALWNQRQQLASMADRLRSLIKTVGHPSDFAPFQCAEIAAFALEFRPDLIIELGRGWGNSTCCFLQVADRLHEINPCRVVSLCLSAEWFTATEPKLKEVCAQDWFQSGEILQCDILRTDFAPLLKDAKRCLLFWDAHGFEIAETVLGRLMPLLANREHVVLMHDMEDIQYDNPYPRSYGETGLWKGASACGAYLWLGSVCSPVAQAISIIDFATRNKMPLHSAAKSLHRFLADDPAKVAELQKLLDNDLFSLNARWFWFSLNEAVAPYTFPRVQTAPIGHLAQAG
jgi:hypothetical protein